MKIQPLLVILTVVNFGLLAVLLSQCRPVVAQGVPTVLRGRALEIVDGQGRVRASIVVDPANTAESTVLLNLASDPSGGPSAHLQTSRDGSGLRLVMGDPRGAPAVKLQASKEGSGLRLADGLETGIDVTAKPTGNFLRVTSRDGREQVVKP